MSAGSPSLAGLTVEDSPSFLRKKSSGKLQLPTAEEPADLDRLLRGHHKRMIDGTFDLAGVPVVVARVFQFLVEEARALADSPLTSHMAQLYVLRHSGLSEAIGHALAGKICEGGSFSGSTPQQLEATTNAYRATLISILSQPAVQASLLADLAKAWIADPACQGLFQPIFFFKGFQAVTTYRVAHQLWKYGGPSNTGAALLLQSRVAELFAVDIHPAATIGAGIMLDHASGIVIGSTAIIGNDCYLLHSTTLGATGKPMGDARRHPKIGNSCTIGAGCTVLGDVEIGDKARAHRLRRVVRPSGPRGTRVPPRHVARRGCSVIIPTHHACAPQATVGAAAVVTRNIPVGGTVIGVNNLLKRKAPPPSPAKQATAKPSMHGRDDGHYGYHGYHGYHPYYGHYGYHGYHCGNSASGHM